MSLLSGVKVRFHFTCDVDDVKLLGCPGTEN